MTRLAWRRIVPKTPRPHATPLLLIHGFACGMDDWGTLPRALARRRAADVLTFDHRGVGASPAPPSGFTVDDMVADARAVLSAAGYARANVMGISLGGMVAQRFAATHAEATNALVLGCTTHGGGAAAPPSEGFTQLAAAWARAHEPNEAVELDAFVRMMLPAGGGGEPALLRRVKVAFRETHRSAAGLQAQLHAMGRFNSTRYLQEIDCPALVVTGDQDAVLPAANSRSLAERLPNCRLEVLQGAGHLFWTHRPAEVVDLLTLFLDECDHARVPSTGT
ncbi:hypothetical protein AB1Y20_009335 [Prymnesium parvum]|uniref:AB hydrolase-1 domain-containing protein n=1 Tax=Prymnesium parvum TaxID=97485 RepID=A0AB34K6B3_PRYPA